MLLFALVVASTSTATTASAQEQADNLQRSPQQVAEQAIAQGGTTEGFNVISSLNIPSGVVSERNDRELTISFVVENQGDKIESNVRPGISLFRIESETELDIVDQMYTDEVFSLAPGEKVTKEIVYTVPGALKGDFAPGATVSNTSGLQLSQTNGLETFTFEEISGSLYAENCRLNIEGDTEDYTITFGADFAPSENASITCSVSNYSQNIIPFKPVVSVYERSLSGQVVATQEYSMEQMLPSETRDVVFNFPPVTKPQAYKIRIDLIHDEFDNVLSNPVLGHFVVQGASATVQSVSPDKASYENGETANISVFVASQADYFGGSRNELNAQIAPDSQTQKYTAITTLTSNGKECSSPVRTDIGDGALLEVLVPVTADCPQAVASVQIEAANGDLLAGADFGGTGESFDLSAPTVPAAVNALVKEDGGVNPIVLVVVLISLLTAIAILFMKKKSSVKILLPAVIIGASLVLMSAETADAILLEAVQNDPSKSGHGLYEASILNFNINDNSCKPNISGTLTVNNCANPTNDPYRGDACATVLVNGSRQIDVAVFTDDKDGGRRDGLAPTFALNYDLPTDKNRFDLEVQYASHCNYVDDGAFKNTPGNYGYTVGSCGNPTACGFRGGSRSSEPTDSQKCTLGGTVVNESFDGSTWRWDCRPTDGGTDDGGCYVDRTLPSVNGQCQGGTFSSHPNASSGCSRGNYIDTADSGSEFLWTCQGTGPGGTDDSCSAPKPATPIAGNCGSAVSSPSTHTSFPTNNLCNNGGAFNRSTTAGEYTWQCGGQHGGADSSVCRASRGAQVAGSCGTAANATPVTAAPSTNLCASGEPTLVNDGGTRYFWQCLGRNGGQDSPTTCEVPIVQSAPTCGVAHNSVYPFAAPTTGLCGSGTSTGALDNGDQWSWTCTAPGQQDAVCSATRNCGQDQYYCSDKCVSITVGGASQANLNRDSTPVIAGQTITVTPGTPAICEPTCTINGQNVPLGLVPTDVEIIHGDNEVTCRVPQADKCSQDEFKDDPDCKTEVEFPKNISCVCQARRCSAQGACVQTNIIASSYSDSQCADDCSDCSGGGMFEPGL